MYNWTCIRGSRKGRQALCWNVFMLPEQVEGELMRENVMILKWPSAVGTRVKLYVLFLYRNEVPVFNNDGATCLPRCQSHSRHKFCWSDRQSGQLDPPVAIRALIQGL